MTAVRILQLADGNLVQLAWSVGQRPRDIQVTPIIEHTCNKTDRAHQKRIDASYPTIKQVSSSAHIPRALETHDIAEVDSSVR